MKIRGKRRPERAKRQPLSPPVVEPAERKLWEEPDPPSPKDRQTFHEVCAQLQQAGIAKVTWKMAEWIDFENYDESGENEPESEEYLADPLCFNPQGEELPDLYQINFAIQETIDTLHHLSSVKLFLEGSHYELDVVERRFLEFTEKWTCLVIH